MWRTTWQAAIPAIICAMGMLYCCFQVQRTSKSRFLEPDVTYQVDVVVHPPEGVVIKTTPRKP
jgi:hypothetical protein